MQDVTERSAVEGQSSDSYGPASKALMGVAAGAIGTWALDRSDWRFWKHEDEQARLQTTAVRPGGEPPAHVLVSRAEKALGLDPTPSQHEIAGTAVHYGIGIGPAIGYAMLRDRLPGSGVSRGLLFGAALFLMQDEGLNTVSGLGASPRKYPWQAHLRGLVSHLVYGVATELALNFMDRSVRRRGGGEAPGRPRVVRG